MEEYARRLSTLTPGFSGADIANLCNEAAILAARRQKEFITTEEFEAASERVIAGLEKKRIISEEERRIVAIHESGHAVTSWFLEGGTPLVKVKILFPFYIPFKKNFYNIKIVDYYSKIKRVAWICSIFT